MIFVVHKYIVQSKRFGVNYLEYNHHFVVNRHDL